MSVTQELKKTDLSFEKKLDQLASVAIHAGLGLAKGQELVMTATLDALPLVRRITEQAYRAGASLVTTLLYGRRIDTAALSLRRERGLRQGGGVAL